MLILLITYFENIMTNTKELMGYSRQIREWSISITRINNILNYSSKQQIVFGMNDNDYISGLVEFKDVSFSYKSKNKGNIADINFIAEPNKITALVGHSGSGKTTITSLILRKHKIDSGTILIDNDDIYEYSKDVYSTNVVGVNQSPFIFNMSIRKNLSLIDSNFENQIKACKRVGIHDYIMSLPKGYNTILTENANNFSGGQKQLLAIARTLLSKAEILIFDDSFSALDYKTDKMLRAELSDKLKDTTMLIVAQRIGTIKDADKIIVLDEGKMVGIGTHEDLLNSCSVYREIALSQLSKEELENE